MNFSVPLDSPFHGSLHDAHIGGVYGVHSRLGTQGDFVLLISNGCIKLLEYVTPDEEWPNDETAFELFTHDHPFRTKKSPSEHGEGGKASPATS